MTEREAYREKANARLEELQARIDLLQAKAKQAKADAKLEYERQMKDLRAQQDQIADQIGQTQVASEEAWEELKTGIDSALASLQDSVDEAAAKFE
jgi:multidrug resistance efflux pump